jgi:Asp/Glu/hydantoin racemase
MKLLVINPNCSASVTALLRTHVAAALGPAAELACVTARFGGRYIADETSFALAGPAALEAYAAYLAGEAYDAQDAAHRTDPPSPTLAPGAPGGGGTLPPDSILIGCFGDPGVWALRELSGLPVTGLAEAAMRQAAALGPFAIVTGGAAWAPMLARLVRALDLGDALTGVHTVAPSGAELAADPAAAIALLQSVCVRAAQGARSVILGGAGLAGMAAHIAPTLSVPLIDSVVAGAQAAWQAGLEGLAARAARGAAPAGATEVAGASARWQGVSPALLRLLARRFPA